MNTTPKTVPPTRTAALMRARNAAVKELVRLENENSRYQHVLNVMADQLPQIKKAVQAGDNGTAVAIIDWLMGDRARPLVMKYKATVGASVHE